MDEPLLLTVDEAAALLRISRNSAYELVARHEIPAIRLGRTIRIPTDALETWMRKAVAGTGGRTDPAAL